jgi:hypothetical protein
VVNYSCQVVVKGRLGREWAELPDGWRMEPQRDGTTLLEGASIDGASVRALLGRLGPRHLVYARWICPKGRGLTGTTGLFRDSDDMFRREGE